MRKTLVLLIILSICITGFEPFYWAGANSGNILFATPQQAQYPSYDQQAPVASYDVQFSPEQLDNLLAPIALYPDPLLAQVLLASTFVDQVMDATQWVRANNDPNMIDMQPWDVSVKAVAHYPTVLFMMNDKVDWTTSLGQAYVDQSTDVMLAVQRLRGMARSSGALVSSPQQQVIVEGGYIRIDPYNPRYIYVPEYDPGLVYYRRSGGAVLAASLISFGAGLVIGAWLNNDFDWRGHRVYYHGWQGGGWISRCRTNVHINNIYVNNSYRTVRVNRTVTNRSVNYNNLNRYSSVHRNVTYSNVHRNRPANTPRGNLPYRQNERTVSPRPQNPRGPQPMTQRAPAQQRQMQRPERQPAPRTQQVRPQQQRQIPQAQRQAQQRTVQPRQPREVKRPPQREAPQKREVRPAQQRQQPAQKEKASQKRDESKKNDSKGRKR